jgi:hypothetical protein
MRRLLGRMAFVKASLHQRWTFVEFLLYETGTLGRRHVRERLGGQRPACACCGAGEDGWMHIWGLRRPRDADGNPRNRGVWSGSGCPRVRAWALSCGLSTSEPLWRQQLLAPQGDDAVRGLVRLVAALARMYKWNRHGDAPARSSSSAHFKMNDRGFWWAWEAETTKFAADRER